MKLKKIPKQLPWYIANKFIVPTTTLLGIGAAKAVDDGGLAKIVQGAAELPVEIAARIANDSGILGYASNIMIDLADNVIEHPAATIGSIAGGYIIGKIGKAYSESKRLKSKYQG